MLIDISRREPQPQTVHKFFILTSWILRVSNDAISGLKLDVSPLVPKKEELGEHEIFARFKGARYANIILYQIQEVRNDHQNPNSLPLVDECENVNLCNNLFICQSNHHDFEPTIFKVLSVTTFLA